MQMTPRKLINQANKFMRRVEKMEDAGHRLENFNFNDYSFILHKSKIDNWNFIPYLPTTLRKAVQESYRQHELSKASPKKKILPNWASIEVPEVPEKYSEEELAKMETILKIGEMPITKKSKFHL
jgi:hypothetical protein